MKTEWENKDGTNNMNNCCSNVSMFPAPSNIHISIKLCNNLSVLTHIASRCDTIPDARFAIWKRTGQQKLVLNAHLRSHFLRIMTRFLSRNKINTSGWAWVVVAGKDDRVVKAREDGKRMFSRMLFFFLSFYPTHVSSNSLDKFSIFSVHGSRR